MSKKQGKRRGKERADPFWTAEMTPMRWKCQPGIKADHTGTLEKAGLMGKEAEEGDKVKGQLGRQRRGKLEGHVAQPCLEGLNPQPLGRLSLGAHAPPTAQESGRPVK